LYSCDICLKTENTKKQWHICQTLFVTSAQFLAKNIASLKNNHSLDLCNDINPSEIVTCKSSRNDWSTLKKGASLGSGLVNQAKIWA